MTIPSQRRYVQYYGHLLRNNLSYSPKTVLLNAVRMEGIPNFSGGTCGKIVYSSTIILSSFIFTAPSFLIRLYRTKIYSSKVYEVHQKISPSHILSSLLSFSLPQNIRHSEPFAELMLPQPVPLCGDIKMEFYHNSWFGGKV